MNITASIPQRLHLQDWLETPDGHALRFAVYRATARPNLGTVVILQGRNEAVEKYHEVIVNLQERGFDAVAFDWRGQGRSTRFFDDGRRGHVDDFSQYRADLELLFRQIVLPEARAPFFMLGHSTGALIALLSAPDFINRVRRMVLISPFLALAQLPLSTAQLSALANTLCFFGLGSSYAAGGPAGIAATHFATNLLTTDVRRFHRNKALMDPAARLGLGGPTWSWLAAATRAIHQVYQPEHMARIHIPTLIVGGAADRLTTTAAMEDYCARLRSGSLLMIDGARHELLQEADFYREQFFAAFDSFVPGSP